MSEQKLGIRIAVEGAAQVSTQMRAVAKNVTDTGAAADKASRLAGNLTQQLRRLAGVVVSGLAVREFVQAADAMALLEARLRATTGAGMSFAQAQADIYRISQANNVGLQETAQLYTKLNEPVKRLGGTTRETSGIVEAFATSLRVGGASAQEASSATLQFAQAMASGRLQGDEFRSMAEASPRFMTALAEGMGQPIERLKEMSTEGKLTADVVGNALLQSLGQLKTEAQTLPDTVGGAFTRLKNDALLAVEVLNDMSGTTGTLADTIGLAAEWVTEMTSAVRELDAGTQGLSGSVDLAALGFGVVGTVLETVVLIASDVSFVLKGIGRELGGIAAQGAALLRGDFAQAGAIHREMQADAARARAELDKFQASVGGATARILASREAMKTHGLSAAENANEMERLTGRVGGATTGFRALKSSIVDTEAANKAAAKAAKEAAAAAKKQAEEVKKIRLASIEAEKKYAEAQAKTLEGGEDVLQQLRDQYIELTAGKEVKDALLYVELERNIALLEYLNISEDGREVSAKERAENDKRIQQLRDEIALRKGIATATASQEAERANKRAADTAVDDWQRASDQIGQSLADALMEGGKSAAEYIKGLFRAMVLKPVIQAAVQPAANAVLGLLGQGGGGSGAGGMLNTASSLASLYGYGAKGYAALTGGTAATGASAQFLAGYQGSTLGAGMAGPTTQGATGAMGAGATTGSSAAWLSTWGAAIAAGIYKANSDWNEGYRRDQAKDVSNSLPGGQFFYGAGSYESDMANMLSKIGFSDRLADLLSGSTAVAKLFGRAAPRITGSGIQGTLGGGDFDGQAYADIYEKGGLFRRGKSYQQFAEIPEEIGRLLDGAAKGVLDKATEYGAALGLPVASLAAVSTELKVQLGQDAEANKEALLTALGGYGDALVAGWADALKPLAAYGETTIQTIERVGQAITDTNSMLDLLGISALDASIEGGLAAQALAEMFGGIEGIAAAATTYYQEFYDAGEKAATSTRLVSEALTEVGLAMPDSREAFRALVEGLDLTTEAGRAQFGVLMNVAGAFAQLNPIIDETAAAAAALAEQQRILAEQQRIAEAIAGERFGLETQLLQLQGDTVALRLRERAALDESNRALYDQITALEDQQAAAALAAEAAQAAAAAQAEAAQIAAGIANERAGLERQLLGLQGDTAAIRALERAALDETNRALYDRITALQDEQAAVLEAERAAREAEQVARQMASDFEATMRQAGADFAALVKATEADLSAAFGAVEQVIGAEIDAIAAGLDAIEDARDALGRESADRIAVLDRSTSDLQRAFDQVESTFGGLARSLRETASGLLDTMDGGAQAREAALRTLRSQLGGITDPEAAQRAATTAANIGTGGYASSVDYRRDTYQTAALIQRVAGVSDARVASERATLNRQLADIAAEVVAIEEDRDRQLALLDEQAGTLQQQLEMATDQLDLARSQYEATLGIQSGVVSVAAALQGLAGAIGAFKQVGGSGAVVTADLVKGSSGRVVTTGQFREFAQAQAGDPRVLYDLAVAEGLRSSDVDAIMGWSAGSSAQWARDQGLPAFAAGGMHTGGARLVGERGPEIEVTGPARIWSAQDTAEMLGNGGRRDQVLVAEIKALRAEVAALRSDNKAQLGAVATHANKSARLLDKWDTEGLPPETTL